MSGPNIAVQKIYLRHLHAQGVPTKSERRAFNLDFYEQLGYSNPIPVDVATSRVDFDNILRERAYVPRWIRTHRHLMKMFDKVAEDFRKKERESDWQSMKNTRSRSDSKSSSENGKNSDFGKKVRIVKPSVFLKNQKKKILPDIKTEIEPMETKEILKELQEKNRELEETRKKLEDQMSVLNGELEELRKKNGELEEQQMKLLARCQQFQDQSKVKDALLQSKDQTIESKDQIIAMIKRFYSPPSTPSSLLPLAESQSIEFLGSVDSNQKPKERKETVKLYKC